MRRLVPLALALALATPLRAQEIQMQLTASVPTETSAIPLLTMRSAVSSNQEMTLTLSEGKSFVLKLHVVGASACALYVNNQFVRGVNCNFESNPIGPGHSWYPKPGENIVITFKASSRSDSSTQSIRLQRPSVIPPKQ